MHDLFGDVARFITNVEDTSITLRRLTACIDCLETRARIQMQLAATVEFGERFVKATYRLEGDGPLCLKAYEEISSLVRFVNTDPVQLPSTTAVARVLYNGVANHVLVWMEVAHECIRPAIRYFQGRFGEGGALFTTMQAFRAARLFNPAKVNEMQPNDDDVDDLRSFPFISAGDGAAMKGELPDYLSACEDTHAGVDVVLWWRGHGELAN